jgi:5,10-methylenetetrahydrofolate reductase
LDHTRKVLQQDYIEQTRNADSFLVLGCGQGVHIMPLGWTDIVPEILNQAEIDIRQSAFNWRLA